jgi:hypothetical protein
VTVVFGLDPPSELLLRKELVGAVFSSDLQVPESRIDTATPRLLVADQWVNVAIESDPFVVPTARGYAPAILVRRPNARQLEHILVGAASLAKPLESLRTRHGTLRGLRVSLKKDSDDKMATYTLRETS